MKDLKAVLAEKETEFRRVGNEVAALRLAAKLCEEVADKPLEKEILAASDKAAAKAMADVPADPLKGDYAPKDTPKEPVKGWP